MTNIKSTFRPNFINVMASTPSGAIVETIISSAGITENIPISLTDTDQHMWAWTVAGKELLQIWAYGNGAGDVDHGDKNIALYGNAIFYGDLIVSNAVGGTGSIYAVNVSNIGRTNCTAKSSVLSASDLVLGATNFNKVTGGNVINGIDATNWYPGDEIILEFPEAHTIKHDGSPSIGIPKIKFDSGTDLDVVAGSIVKFVLNYDATYWLCTGVFDYV